MQNKKLILILSVFVIFAGVAAFVAGRIFNRGVGPLNRFGPEGDGISILPAEELPKAPPEVEGLFVERLDNIIVVETSASGGDGVSGSPVGMGGGPKVEVAVTAETAIYHDTTEPPFRPPSGNDPRELQQTVEAGTLDDLTITYSLVMVWGRKSGDRIIADVLVYSDLGIIKKP